MPYKDLEGIWSSKYHFRDAKELGIYRVALKERGIILRGKSTPSSDGSGVDLIIVYTPADRTLMGTWRATSTIDSPKPGKSFRGTLLMNVDEDKARAEGEWMAKSEGSSEILNGGVVLRRLVKMDLVDEEVQRQLDGQIEDTSITDDPIFGTPLTLPGENGRQLF